MQPTPRRSSPAPQTIAASAGRSGLQDLPGLPGLSVLPGLSALSVLVGLLVLLAGPAAQAGPLEPRATAPAVSIGERSGGGPAHEVRLPRTLPGTRAAERRRLSNLDPADWLARYGAVSSRATRDER